MCFGFDAGVISTIFTLWIVVEWKYKLADNKNTLLIL